VGYFSFSQSYLLIAYGFSIQKFVFIAALWFIYLVNSKFDCSLK